MMLLLLLLLLSPLLWGGSLQEQPGYELQVQESVRVHQGLCVHVPCSFSYPRSSRYFSGKFYIYWYRLWDNTGYTDLVATNDLNKPVKGDTRGRFYLQESRTNDCSLRIRNARNTDTGTYVFRVERGSVKYTYQDKKLNLQVIDKPDILIQEPLQPGRPTQLTCSLPGSWEGGRPFTFSWAGAAVDSLNPQNLHSSVLAFTPKLQDHGTNLTCKVERQWPSVTTERTILLNVFYAPRSLTIGVSFTNFTALKILQTTSLPVMVGEALRLLCVADSNPPAQLSWFRGSSAVNAALFSSTGILELPHVGTGEEGQFTCQAQHPLGSQSISVNLSVVYPPQLLGPSCFWEDENLNCSCSSRAQPAPSLHWLLGESLLEATDSNASFSVSSNFAGPWANSSLSLYLGLSAGLRLSCEVENAYWTQRASVLLLPGQSLYVPRAVPAALGGAGAMALLSLSLCLISFCILKFCRKQTGRRRRVTNDEDAVMGTVTWVSDRSQQNSQPDRPPDPVSPMGYASPSREEQDTEYANITFHGRKLCEAQDKEATSTCVYSKIKKTSK